MTLLTIAQNVAVELNLRRPSAVIGSTDQDTRQILRAINVECDALREAAYWQRLRKERPFTGIAGTTQTGILPSDFDRMVPETFWNLSSTRLFSNVQDEVQWQGLVATSYVGPQPQFIIRGNELMVLPALSGGESLSFIYMSTEFVRAADNTPKSAFTVDTDTTVLDEPLITLGACLRELARLQQPLGTYPVEYQDRRTRVLERDAPTSGTMAVADIFSGARSFTGTPLSGSTINGY
jgi:hypothetical protein